MGLLSASNSLLGGLGLFLVGMWLMTDGLKLAAGNALRDILQVWTNTRTRGLVTGFFMTALVQSSSAVTVATIGFANAGLLTLERAIWVLFGSNVGTTMTGWLVVLIGFKVNIELYALPLIGAGMLIRLSGQKSRRAAIGEAITGFGLFFLGISVLKGAFEVAGADITLPGMAESGIIVLVLYVLVGFVLTSLMQSSSAAMVITLGATEGGLIPLSVAAAMVIGTNLGTTTTAILAVWGANPNAKRVASSHVLFNLITAVTAIIIILPMLSLVGIIQELMELPEAPATTIALFHTVFNIMGVIIMLPLAKYMIAGLQKRFITGDEEESRPKYLDHTVLEIPALAVRALGDELNRVNKMAVRAATDAINIEEIAASQVITDSDNLELLATEIGNYVAKLSQAGLPAEIADTLPEVILNIQEYVTMVNMACEVVSLQEKIHIPEGEDAILEMVARLKQQCVHLQSRSMPAATDFSLESLEQELSTLEETYDALRLVVLKAATQGKLGMITVDAQLHQANLIRSMSRRCFKAARRLSKINQLFGQGVKQVTQL